MISTHIQFKIVTPAGVMFESPIDALTLPTIEGQITVLPNHIPLMSLLQPGEMTIVKDGTQAHFAISRGILEVGADSHVAVLSDTADRAQDIDLLEAERARERAEEMLKEKEALNEIEFSRVQAALDRELARIKVYNKYYRR